MRTIEIGAWMPPIGPHARQAPAAADDDLAADRLAQQRVRAADVLGALGGDGRGLQPEAVRHDGLGGVEHDLVAGAAAVLEREVVALDLERQPGHVGVEHPEGLLQQLLAGLVALHDHEGPGPGQVGDGTASSIA